MYKLQLVLDWQSWMALSNHYDLTWDLTPRRQYRRAMRIHCTNRLLPRPAFATIISVHIKTNCAQCLIGVLMLLTKFKPVRCRFNNTHTNTTPIYYFLNFALLRDATQPDMPIKIFADYLEEKHPRPNPIFLDAARHFPELDGNITCPNLAAGFHQADHRQHPTAEDAFKHVSHQECIEWLNGAVH